MKQKAARPRTVYLLHFDLNVGRCKHYIGITYSRRIVSRMLEHVSHKGAKLTGRLAKQGAGFTLVRIWSNVDFDFEKRLKANGHYRRHCRLCTDSPGRFAASGFSIHYDPIEPCLFGIDWP